MSLLSALPIIGDWAVKREERKKVQEELKAKVALGKTDANAKVALTKEQWNMLALKGSAHSWKDEWLMGIFSVPLVVAFVGAVWFVFTGDMSLLEASKIMFNSISEHGIEYGTVMTLMVMASFGIRVKNGNGKV